ncbi:guanylate kinase [Stomatohabitans albus]|uniref:guanylate kinase n=1 Tax=Stomatohabitans albus TaxID=3110766 RepID=UPI00300D266C
MSQRVQHIVIISGPGGVGKDTIVRALLERHAQDGTLTLARSATTRPPRPGEVQGEDYDFLTPEAFDQMIREDQFLEWATFGDNRYGTPSYIIDQADTDTIILVIDCQGHAQVRSRPGRIGDAMLRSIFIAPPSWDVLEARLKGRDGDHNPDIARRLAIGREEYAMRDQFDHVVINDDLNDAVDQIDAIISHLDE